MSDKNRKIAVICLFTDRRKADSWKGNLYEEYRMSRVTRSTRTRKATIQKPKRKPVTKLSSREKARRAHQSALDKLGRAYGAECGKGSVAAKKSSLSKGKQVVMLFGILNKLLTKASPEELRSPWHMLAKLTSTIHKAKEACRKACRSAHKANGTEASVDDVKNSTNGLRKRIPAMNRFLELASEKLAVAIGTVTLVSGKKRLVWTEALPVWSTILESRTSRITQKVARGIDIADPRRTFILGVDYKKTYSDSLTSVTLKDGSVEQHCEVKHGPNGAERVTKCRIELVVLGEHYDEIKEALPALKDIVANHEDFLKSAEDMVAADYPEFVIPADGVVNIPEEAQAAYEADCAATDAANAA